MKHLKLFEKFTKIYEDSIYGKVNKFYHKTSKDNLPKLMNGIDSKIKSNNRHSKTQGGGFYVWNNIEDCKSWSEGDLIIEIEAELNTKNFDVDYELHGLKWYEYYNVIIGIIKNSNLKTYILDNVNDIIWDDNDEVSAIKKITQVDFKTYKFEHTLPIFIISNDNITKDDIIVENFDSTDFNGILKVTSKTKNIGHFQVVKFDGDAQEAYNHMESLDKFGIKEKFGIQVLCKSKAVKYFGPKIFPTKHWLLENGKWVEQV
jgi:hypothetical protein